MHPAARPLLLVGSATWLVFAGMAWAAEAPAARSAPSRPGTAAAPAPVPASTPTAAPAAVATPSVLPGRKVGRTDYVALADVARQLELKLAWIEPGKKLTLKGTRGQAEIETETRDITVNGLRVFLGDPVTSLGGQAYVSRIDYERCLTPLLRPGFGVASRPVPKTIVLDAGHGGKDPGNTKLKLSEKTLTLDLVRRTRKLLEKEGFRVVLTREDDSFVAVPQRAMLANLAKADAFVSVHFTALASNDTKTSGVEVYTFAPRFQRSTNAWGPAEKNDTEDYASPGNRFDHWNVVLAQALHRQFVVGLKAPDRGKKLMHLAVLRPLNCPGALIECGFLTSETEAPKIATPEYRQKLAEALAAGIREYAATLGKIARPSTGAKP